MKIENKELVLILDEKTGCFTVIDRNKDIKWGCDPWNQSSGEVVFSIAGKWVVCDLSRSGRIAPRRVETEDGSGFHIVFEDLVSTGGEMLRGARVETVLLLHPAWAQVTVRVMQVETGAQEASFVSLRYPLRQFALATQKDSGYLAVPCWQGALIPSILPPVHAPDFWQLDDDFHMGARGEMVMPASGGWHGLSMPWFGVAKERSGFAAILLDPEDCQVSLIANYNGQHRFTPSGKESPYPRIASLSPVWLATRGKFGYPREMRYVFLREASYVAMAKTYRAHVQGQGRLRLLPEKIAACPQVERLLGATSLWLYGAYPHYARHAQYTFSWRDLDKLVRDLGESLSLDRAIITLMDHHADEPPLHCAPDPARGTEAELKQAIAVAKQQGFLVALYGIYQSALEGTPSWKPAEMRRAQSGLVWRDHRWALICSSLFKERAAQYVGRLAPRVGSEAAYIDCVTVESFEECWHAKHPQSRREDKAARLAMLEHLKSLHLAVCSEAARAWAAHLCDYSMGAANHSSVPRPLGYFEVPLFNLVYHDSLVTYRHAEDDYAKVSQGDYVRRSLQDMLHGRAPVFTLAYFEYERWRSRIQEANKVVGKFARMAAMQELVDHEGLTSDFMVQRSRFGSEVEITVNLGPVEFVAEHAAVPPFGFLVKGPNGRVAHGQYMTQFHGSVR